MALARAWRCMRARKRWTAERVAGSGYLSQDDARMHFGLGAASVSRQDCGALAERARADAGEAGRGSRDHDRGAEVNLRSLTAHATCRDLRIAGSAFGRPRARARRLTRALLRRLGERAKCLTTRRRWRCCFLRTDCGFLCFARAATKLRVLDAATYTPVKSIPVGHVPARHSRFAARAPDCSSLIRGTTRSP